LKQFCKTIIRNASVFDGTGADPEAADVALSGDRILAVGPALDWRAENEVDAEGLALARASSTHTPTTTMQTAEGIMAVWVNGVLSYQEHKPRNQCAGRFLPRAKTAWLQ